MGPLSGDAAADGGSDEGESAADRNVEDVAEQQNDDVMLMAMHLNDDGVWGWIVAFVEPNKRHLEHLVDVFRLKFQAKLTCRRRTDR